MAFAKPRSETEFVLFLVTPHTPLEVMAAAVAMADAATLSPAVTSDAEMTAWIAARFGLPPGAIELDLNSSGLVSANHSG